MDSRRLIIFVIISLGILLLWEKYFAPAPSIHGSAGVEQANRVLPNNNVNDVNYKLKNSKLITVTTDVLQAQISLVGGDIRGLDLLKQGKQDNPKEPYQLLYANPDNNVDLGSKGVFIAQSGLVSDSNVALPSHSSLYSVDKYNYVLEPSAQEVQVVLKATESGGQEVFKTYTFKRNSYIVDISYRIINNTNASLGNVSAYWRILRNKDIQDNDSRFVHTFAGGTYYTNEDKFHKIAISDILKNEASYPEQVSNGWVGFVQHYFGVVWLLNPYGYDTVCDDGVRCRLNFKEVDNNLISVGLLTDLPTIKAHSTYSIAVPLFAGPEQYSALITSAPELERVKDYGWVYIFSTPLFWLLVKLYDFVKNWGYAIILLTLVVKLVLYPLTRASYISIAKMKALAPRVELLRKEYGDDKMKLQQAMMQMYRTEKVSPIGGCLPMLLQIPVFIGLYWALLSSVELRQATFLWIHDLSLPDPYYILPVILAITTYVQTLFNPPPTDPVQAKMMKIMPLAFSVMFFFFPAGLVLYWLVNNLLTILQQWYVNNHVALKKVDRKKIVHKKK